MTANGPAPRTAAADRRRKATRTFVIQMIIGFTLYALGLAAGSYLPSLGVSPWWGALLLIPGIGLMALPQVAMYRSGDELERTKIAEAVMLAFLISTPLIFAVGALQFTVLPELNWIFAFSILMLSWIIGTIVSAIRYR